ncbi:MAG TPA: hypothetical protein VK498_13805 [Ferruginibacter sp.]|nr:hypothetical protein [Ferruginibacter sp.]
MEIIGTIDKWGCPIFQCDIANTGTFQKTTVKAVIDTGAFDYCLKQIYIEALQLPIISEIEINHPTEGKRNAYKYKGAILFGENVLPDIEIQPLILENYEHDFIIGTRFLLGKSFKYESLNDQWMIYW